MSHPDISELALLAGNDLGWWSRRRLQKHVENCARCRDEVSVFTESRRLVRDASAMPTDLNWGRLAMEMKANIRLGLAAGCLRYSE